MADVDDNPPLDDWEDERLLEQYRRSSHELRKQGFDPVTVHLMGCLEEELWNRDLNPDSVAKEIDHSQSA